MVRGSRALWGLVERRLGLQGKVLALYLASALVILPTTALLYAGTLAEHISQEYQNDALAIWRTFDATYESAEDLRGPLVQERIVRLQEANANVREIRVYTAMDSRFLVVASSAPAILGQPAAVDDLQPMLQDRTVWRELTHHGEAVAELGAPLHGAGRPIGVLTVHFRLAPRDALIQRQVMSFLGITGVGGLILLAALYWELQRVVLRPLLFLQRHAAAIAQGDLGHRTAIRRNDEVGELAADFNQMAESLERREGENLRLQQELRARYEEAEQRAVRDPITDLYNHGHFYERLAQEIARARRFDQPMALLFCDLDHFKALNDVHGHLAGDLALKAVAAILRGSVREIDIAARYGGEEFTIILPNTEAAGALEVAERIRSRVSRYVIALTPDATASITLSIGIACLLEDASTEAELVRCADLAMYHAKRLGRNQVRAYGELKELMKNHDDADAWGKEAVYFETVQSLAAAVDARDNYTHRHSDSVSRYATALARAMGLDGPLLTQIAIAGLLHDVGKIGIPDQILGKTGALTEEEWVKMRQHPAVGKTIIQHITAYEQIVPLILHHHERWDGAGYPDGVAGDGIPLGARIIAVVDAYHAMTSDRPYRKALSRAEALLVLSQEAARQFDPEAVRIFLQIPEESLFGSVEPVVNRGEDHEP